VFENQLRTEYPQPYAGMADAYVLLGSVGGASLLRQEAMKVVPYYVPLRADPRFVRMLKSVGLEPSATSQ
jgi:hypothetical protein